MQCLISNPRALLEHIWLVVAEVAEAIGADVYDWDSTLSLASRASCVEYDGVHPSMQVKGASAFARLFLP
jgi:hypothetical protein